MPPARLISDTSQMYLAAEQVFNHINCPIWELPGLRLRACALSFAAAALLAMVQRIACDDDGCGSWEGGYTTGCRCRHGSVGCRTALRAAGRGDAE